MDGLKRQPTFILLGAAGYVAPRHMAAIKQIGGDLLAAVDPCDSVGVLDSYFPNCKFYKHHLDCFEDVRADYVSICTPNHQHALQACQAMQAGMDVIVEKPVALTVARLIELQEIEAFTKRKVNCILNLRLHRDAVMLRSVSRLIKWRSIIDIEYHTPRGDWYSKSWKMDKAKSGGLLFNIGVHLFDLVLSVFGPMLESPAPCVSVDETSATGSFCLESGDVLLRLSINGRPKHRAFVVNGVEFDFTNGFDDLHAESYRRIVNGKGFGLEDARASIEICERLS